MKNIFIRIIGLSLFWLTQASDCIAQQPGIHFEAIAKDRNNNPAKDRRIYVKVEIIPTNTTNGSVFIEEHSSRTNSAGIFQIQIGKGIRTGGNYSSILDIPWKTLNYNLKIQVAIEPVINVINWNYQNDWIDLGTSPFGIVPYAGTALTVQEVPANAAVISFSGGSTGLTPSTASQGNIVLGGVLAIANGGTGSTTKNFVDLSTPQQVNGEKTFTEIINANNGLAVSGAINLSGNTSPLQLSGQAGSSGDVLVSRGANTTPQWVSAQTILGVKSKNRSNSLTATEVFFIPVSGLDANDGISVVMETDAVPRPIPSYYIFRDIQNSRVEVHFTAPYTGYVTWVIVE
ncbi:MAG TPA: hypothetical protein DCP55_06995 [Chitinophagaceae bacterium]|nr:hypothetical protein [Chitinophagaceae bacterium]